MIAIRTKEQQNACMASITIRDVPEDTRFELASRAARSGRSMQEYLRRRLIEMADEVDSEELWVRVGERTRLTGSQLSADAILEAVHDGRR